MSDPCDTPRLFGLPPGIDFARAFLDGLKARLADLPPQAMARVLIFTNTRRMARRLTDLLVADGPGFLPRILSLADLGADPLLAPDLPPAVSPLVRRLELTRAVDRLLAARPDLGQRSHAYDLADSLALLMDEMNEEDVSFDALRDIDTGAHQEHWQIALSFLTLLEPYLSADHPPDPAARRLLLLDRLLHEWQDSPPNHPVIVAGSTGSRRMTARLIQAVAGLPQGAVVLPGLDPALPSDIARHLARPDTPPDHAQSALMRLIASCGLTADQVRPWHDTPPPDMDRLKLVSLAMRPAPVTDQWLAEGPRLGDPVAATRNLTLIEARTERDEAQAVALCLRGAVERGRTAALVTPDRVLARRVTAALQRWGIAPDDSAGQPLPLTPPGIFLRLIAELFAEPLTADRLLALLNHPLTHAGGGRQAHLDRSRRLELEHLRGGPAFVDPAAIAGWADALASDDPAAPRWGAWLKDCLDPVVTMNDGTERPLAAWLQALLAAARALAAGSEPDGTDSALWARAAGEEAHRQMQLLEQAAHAAGPMPAAEFAALLRRVLDGAAVRATVTAHPQVMIRGTLEARALGADLVVMAGLNEGIWPARPAPDPWLSRQMRLQAGLLPPERRIGLSAHDFLQAIAAPEVVLSRAMRDAEAPTVASRWLIRLTSLLEGLGEPGQAALGAMRERGALWTGLARLLDRPERTVPPAPRPCPCPPVATRPRRLSVTRITTLVRDPYAIYAGTILRLRPLAPLRPLPDDPRLRGEALHKVMECFIDETRQGLPDDAEALLNRIAAEVLERMVPWPATRRLWASRLAAAAPTLIADERRRRETASPFALEVTGRLVLTDPDFTLTAKADRIDRMPGGRLAIIDYKSGTPPSKDQVKQFDHQLPLEALMASEGAFEGIDPAPVGAMTYVGLRGKTVQIDPDEHPPDRTLADLRRLLTAWLDPARGYMARARIERTTDETDYDHLSRLGEWDHATPATPQPVGQEQAP